MADHTYKPSEVPKGERWQYFLDYYKRPLIIGIVAVIAVISLVKGIFFKTETDVSIVSVSAQYISNDLWNAITPSLSEMLPDYNEDGQTAIYINPIYLDVKNADKDPDTYSAMQTKLMVDLSTAEYALQIVDEEFFAYLESELLVGTYSELPESFGKAADEVIKIPLKDLAPFGQFKDLPEGLYMTLRPKDAMQLGNSKKKLAFYEQQIDALCLMIKANAPQ